MSSTAVEAAASKSTCVAAPESATMEAAATKSGATTEAGSAASSTAESAAYADVVSTAVARMLASAHVAARTTIARATTADDIPVAAVVSATAVVPAMPVVAAALAVVSAVAVVAVTIVAMSVIAVVVRMAPTPSVPWPNADEYAASEPAWTVIAVRRTRIWIVGVIAPGAIRRTVVHIIGRNRNNRGSHANSYRDLCMSSCRKRHSKEQCNQYGL
jgi:hypothetical protein